MKKNSDKHAFLILSDCVSESLIRLYLQVKASTVSWGETFIVYHNKTNNPEPRLTEYNTYEFTNSVLHELGYTPVRNTLVPGSNHFPILKFYLDNPNYDYYWCIEDDIVFSGAWSSLFSQIINKHSYDFISSYIKYKKDNINPDWFWWDSLIKTGTVINENDLAMSFNPIYSLSNRAAGFLNQSLKDGWTGHHEVLMATLFILHKFKVKDFGGKGKFVPRGFKNKFYTGATYKWRPSFKAAGQLINKIYHPVKNEFKITADFKYKISLCVIINNNWDKFKQSILKNIEDSLDYENFEFVILDYKSRTETEAWFKENINDLLNSGKIVYYNLGYAKEFSRSHANNLACKLASGDIICLIDSGQLIGKDFNHYINDQFKMNSNIIIVSPNVVSGNEISTSNYRVTAVKKEDFLYAKGFDEQIKTAGLEDTDLISRLELFRIKKVTQNDSDFTPQYLFKKFSLENEYIFLDKILIHHVDPSNSKAIFIYSNGVFEMCTIINNATKKSEDFKYSYQKRPTKSKFILTGKSWITGMWSLTQDDEALKLITERGSKMLLHLKERCYETTLRCKNVAFHIINLPEDKKELINLHYQFKNQHLFKNNTFKNIVHLNSAGFGRATVYKNFCSDFQIIIN